MATNGRRQGRSHEGVPNGDPIIEVTVRLFPATSAGGPSGPPKGGPFGGATIEWSYPDHLHERALTRVAAVRHAISVLLDDLQGITNVDVQ
jgi:hypothetical protein